MMKRVMLVEDEEFILQGILCIVDWPSINMELAYTAHNGMEALEKFRADPVDIVVTDVEMPLMDGLELIREIRKTDQRARCLILSGYDEFEYARKALSMDVDEYILKPINEELLGAALEKAGKKLDDMDRKQAANMEEKIGWAQFLKITGGMKKEERKSFIQMLPEIPDSGKIFPALIKIDLESLDEEEGITPILIEFQERKNTACLSKNRCPAPFILLWRRYPYSGCGKDFWRDPESAGRRKRDHDFSGGRFRDPVL